MYLSTVGWQKCAPYTVPNRTQHLVPTHIVWLHDLSPCQSLGKYLAAIYRLTGRPLNPSPLWRMAYHKPSRLTCNEFIKIKKNSGDLREAGARSPPN